MAGVLQLQFVVKTKANTPVGCSIQWTGADGEGENVGLGDQTTNARGQTTFNLEPALLIAVASSRAPGTLRVWARHGGTAEDAPPIGDAFVEEIPVV